MRGLLARRRLWAFWLAFGNCLWELRSPICSQSTKLIYYTRLFSKAAQKARRIETQTMLLCLHGTCLASSLMMILQILVKQMVTKGRILAVRTSTKTHPHWLSHRSVIIKALSVALAILRIWRVAHGLCWHATVAVGVILGICLIATLLHAALQGILERVAVLWEHRVLLVVAIVVPHHGLLSLHAS